MYRDFGFFLIKIDNTNFPNFYSEIPFCLPLLIIFFPKFNPFSSNIELLRLLSNHFKIFIKLPKKQINKNFFISKDLSLISFSLCL